MYLNRTSCPNRHLVDSIRPSYRGGVDDVLEALAARERTVHHLIEDCGAGRLDLIDVGLTAYTAGKQRHAILTRVLAQTESMQIAPIGLPDAVALVSMNELGRRYLDHGVYIRDAELKVQVRLRATHLGYSKDGKVEAVRPISRRWRIGSAAAIPTTGVANLVALMAEPDVDSSWPGPATLLELGDPISAGLPLGFAPSANGAAPALRGVRHVLLNDLFAAARRGATLVDVQTL